MPDQKPVWIDGKRVWVPADATEDEINQLFPAAKQPQQQPQSRTQQVLHSPAAETAKATGATAGVAAGVIPAATRGAWAVAQSDLPQTLSTLSKVAHYATPVVAGTHYGGPWGALSGMTGDMLLAAHTAYDKGWAGYMVGRGLRNAAAKVAPYGEAIQKVVPPGVLTGVGRVSNGLIAAQAIRQQWMQEHPDEAKGLSYGQQMLRAHKDLWEHDKAMVAGVADKLRSFVGLTPTPQQPEGQE